MKTKEQKLVGAQVFPWDIPDVFYPDPDTAYLGLTDNLNAADRLTFYAAALRPYFLSALEQVSEDVEKSKTQKNP